MNFVGEAQAKGRTARAAADDPLISLRSISKTFSNGTLALQDMSLDVGRGEFVSLLGPSGCGKSTALRIIAGLGEPTSGTIEWPTAEYDASGRPHPEIGFVFQEPTLMPWATVFANVWLPLRLKGDVEVRRPRRGDGGACAWSASRPSPTPIRASSPAA